MHKAKGDASAGLCRFRHAVYQRITASTGCCRALAVPSGVSPLSNSRQATLCMLSDTWITCPSGSYMRMPRRCRGIEVQLQYQPPGRGSCFGQGRIPHPDQTAVYYISGFFYVPYGKRCGTVFYVLPLVFSEATPPEYTVPWPGRRFHWGADDLRCHSLRQSVRDVPRPVRPGQNPHSRPAGAFREASG